MPAQKEEAYKNFIKAKGQIAQVIKMVEEDRYCIDIMQQNLALIGLLRSAHQMLMENHLKTCFKNAMETKNAMPDGRQEKRKEVMTQEILKVTKLFNK